MFLLSNGLTQPTQGRARVFSDQSNEGPKPNTGERNYGSSYPRTANVEVSSSHRQMEAQFLGDGLSTWKVQVFEGWIFLQLVNCLECRLGRQGGHPIGCKLSEGGGMSCPWKGMFPPHGPGVLGRDTQPTARYPWVAGTPFCHPVV